MAFHQTLRQEGPLEVTQWNLQMHTEAQGQEDLPRVSQRIGSGARARGQALAVP